MQSGAVRTMVLPSPDDGIRPTSGLTFGLMAKLGTQPPYTTAADIASFFERIANKQPPAKLETQWVETYGIAANQPAAITTLVKWLGIVDESGAAKTEIWNKIRQPESRPEGLAPLVRDAYSAVFDRIDVETANRDDLNGVFIDAYGVGDAKNKVKCFATLCEYAGITTAAGTRSSPARAATTNGTKATTKSTPQKAKQDPPAKTARNGKKDTGSGTSPSVMIALNVEVPAAWTEDEIRERIAIVSRAVWEAKLDQA
jgi:hypothetical protein